MVSKLALLLLGAMLLVQNTYSAPTPESASSEKIESNPLKGVTERLKLIEITLLKLSDLHKLIVENGSRGFKKVLVDPQLKEITTGAMKEHVSHIQKIYDALEKYSTRSESSIFEIVEEFTDLVKKFDKDENEKLSEEEKVIEKSFKENCVDEFLAEVKENFTKFFEEFEKEIDRYIQGLSEAEKKDELKLITWFGKLKEEHLLKNQFDLLNNFFADLVDTSSCTENEE